MTDDANSRPRWRPRWPAPAWWALFASVCLNVGLASFIAVRLWSTEPQANMLQTPEQLIAMLQDRLPPEDAKILADISRANEGRLRAARAASRGARARIMVELAQRDLDKDGVRAAFSDAREKRIAVGDIVVEILEQTLERLSPDVRQRLVGGYRLR